MTASAGVSTALALVNRATAREALAAIAATQAVIASQASATAPLQKL